MIGTKLDEIDYCANLMAPKHCTAAGRYLATDGRVLCGTCAAGWLVVKLKDLPRVIDLIAELLRTVPAEGTSHLHDELREYVAPYELSDSEQSLAKWEKKK